MHIVNTFQCPLSETNIQTIERCNYYSIEHEPLHYDTCHSMLTYIFVIQVLDVKEFVSQVYQIDKIFHNFIDFFTLLMTSHVL